MKYHLIIASLLVLASCNNSDNKKDNNIMIKKEYSTAIENLVNFFNKNATYY